MPGTDHNFWFMIVESTPPALRWVFTVLTAGLYGLAWWIWKRHVERLRLIEEAQKSFASKTDIERVEGAISKVHERVDKIIWHFNIDKER